MLAQVLEKLSLDAINSQVKVSIDEFLSKITQTTKGDECWSVLFASISDLTIRSLALAATQKLIAHSIIKGIAVSVTDHLQTVSEFSYCGEYDSKFRLVDDIIILVADISFKDSRADVLLQILKLFLTIVTQENLIIHPYSLMLIYKVCFFIHTFSPPKSTNEITAKASLTQMIDLIFSRAEKFSLLTATSDDQITIAIDVKDQIIEIDVKEDVGIKSDQIIEIDVKEDIDILRDQIIEIDVKDQIIEIDVKEDIDISRDQIIANVKDQIIEIDVKEDIDILRDQIIANVKDQIIDIDIISDQRSVPELETEILSKQILPKDINNRIAPIPMPIPSPFSKIYKAEVKMTLKFLSSNGISIKNQDQKLSPSINSYSEITLTDEVTPSCTKDRTLALELILSVFNNIGASFREDESNFVIVQEHICLVVLRNAITTDPIIFELSLSIFLLIIRFYRQKLKMEIEVQLKMYLQILEMGNSTYKQKSNILQALLKICENPQILLDIYWNYDCEFEMSSIYEKIVALCSKISQGRGETKLLTSKDSNSSRSIFVDAKLGLVRQQERRLHLRALSVLTAIIQSLSMWCHDWSSSSIAGIVLRKEEIDEASRLVNRATGETLTIVSPSISQDSIIDETSPVQIQEVVEITDNSQADKITSKKQIFRHAVQTFNSNPKRGMKEFIEAGFVEQSHTSISSFLLSTSELNKASIGEYIGEGSAFNIKVMHALIDSLDFAGLEFVTALRQFLQSFRLPGEAQKIDRMMEKFADRYCELNPTVFARADTAYTLAFSVIMLNTDQHSAQIKHRMDKGAFVKNNQGINDDGDLPDEFIGSIFDDISGNEIIMENERSDKLIKMTMGWGAGELNERKRLDTYKKEVSMIQKKSQMQNSISKYVSSFRPAVNKELARPMFSTCSWAIMAALSLSFEAALESDEPRNSRQPNVPDLCLKAFVGGIKIACLFRLETERDAYVSSLAKLTSLGNYYEIRPKNIKAINSLIEIATISGESLENGWFEIMKSLSLIEKLQVGVIQAQKLSEKNIDDGEVTSPIKDVKNPHVTKVLANYVEVIQSQASIIVIDRIFTTSVQLSAQAIIYFFKAVCQVSLEEVGMSEKGELTQSYSHPRMYLLQKIVEIAHYNMHRIRFEWTQIWRILQPHFNKVACHPNARVSNFAVDSLRQLGVKFLDREELGQFSTQHEFLKSFEWIIKNNQSYSTRELILNSLSQLITSKASRIKSGWKPIFVTLVKAAQTDEKMAQTSFQNIQLIFRQHFEHVVNSGGFVDLVSCLAECALIDGSGPVHDELVMSSIQMLQSCTKSLIERATEEKRGKIGSDSIDSVIDSGSPIKSPHSSTILPRINNLPQQAYLLANGCISEEHFYLSWFPILSAFSRVVKECQGVLVRTHTMEILFETIKACAHLFDSPYWKTISRNIVTPIFEDLNDLEATTLKESNSAVLVHGLRLLVQLVDAHFSLFIEMSTKGDLSTSNFLYSCIDRMAAMMTNPNEKLASTGRTCFEKSIFTNVDKFDDKSWIWVTNRLVKSLRDTLPAELIKCQEPSSYDSNGPIFITEAALAATDHLESFSLDNLDFEKTVVKCIMHVELLSTVNKFCLLRVREKLVISIMPEECRAKILHSFYKSYVVARLFNSLKKLRHAIHKRGWVSQWPNLLKQETESLSTYLNLLFKVAYDDFNHLCTLSREIIDLFTRFESLLQEPARNQRDIATWSYVVELVVTQLVEQDQLWKTDGPLRVEIARIYSFVVRMMVVEKLDARLTFIAFLKKLGEEYIDNK